MNKGYIKLFRRIEEFPFYKNSDAVHLWIHLYIRASREPFEKKFSGKVVDLKAGQLVTNRLELSRETGISESKVQRLLKMLESEQQIEQQTGTKNRVITVVNWVEEQEREQQSEQQKPDKKANVNTLRPEGVEDSTWRDFKIHRKEKKGPITETAMKGIIREADIAGMTIENVLKKIMDSGWRGFKAEWIVGKNPKTGRCKSDLQYELPIGKDF